MTDCFSPLGTVVQKTKEEPNDFGTTVTKPDIDL